MNPDQELVAELTAQVRRSRGTLDFLDQKRADALVELQSIVGQALQAGADWDLMEEISGLDLAEFVISQFRKD